MAGVSGDSDLEDAIPATPEPMPAKPAPLPHITTLATADAMTTQTHSTSAFNKQLLHAAEARRFTARQHFNTVAAQPAVWQTLMVEGAELQRQHFVQRHFPARRPPQAGRPEVAQTPRMAMASKIQGGPRPAFVQGLDVVGDESDEETSKGSETESSSQDTSAVRAKQKPGQAPAVVKSAQYGWLIPVDAGVKKAAKPREPWEDDGSEDGKAADDGDEEVYVPRPTRTRGAGKTA